MKEKKRKKKKRKINYKYNNCNIFFIVRELLL